MEVMGYTNVSETVSDVTDFYFLSYLYAMAQRHTEFVTLLLAPNFKDPHQILTRQSHWPCHIPYLKQTQLLINIRLKPKATVPYPNENTHPSFSIYT